jgi:hypothetical protein
LKGLIIDDPTSIAVLAPTFQLSKGAGVAFIESIVAKVELVRTPGTSTTIEPLDLSSVIQVLTNNCSFTYAGSLTTPPRSEGVAWLIPNERLPITVDQFNTLKSVLKFNSRYLQNTLGDVNILQVAAGNDTNVAATAEQLAGVLGEEGVAEVEKVVDGGTGAFGGKVGSVSLAVAGNQTCSKQGT